MLSKRSLRKVRRRGGLRGGVCNQVLNVEGNDVTSCVLNGSGLSLGMELGRGQQGIAYSIRQNDRQVIKSTVLKTKKDTDAWGRESCYSKEIGSLGVAPQIYNYFVCKGIGYIVMERLITINNAYPGVREKKIVYDENNEVDRNEDGSIAYDTTDHVALLPLEVQRGFVNSCAVLLNNGFIHMDNHLDNVGFLSNQKPILFDFGFTQKRDFSGPNDYEWALAFSIFQFLEHAPIDEIEETIFYQIINSIFNDSLEGPSDGIASFTSFDVLRPLRSEREFLKRLKELKEIACAASNDIQNADIALGTMCYAILVQMPREDRYESKFLDIVYDIRTGNSPPMEC